MFFNPLYVFAGGTGEKDRPPISHESFLLMANSQTDMDDWVKAIRRVIWAPFGGGKANASSVERSPQREPNALDCTVIRSIFFCY